MRIHPNNKYILANSFGPFDHYHLFAKVLRTYKDEKCSSGTIIVVDIYYFDHVRRSAHLDSTWLGYQVSDEDILKRVTTIVKKLL